MVVIDILFLFLTFFFFAIGSIILFAYFFNYRKKDPLLTKYYGVSVLIPVWNEEKTIGSTLDAVIDMKTDYKGDFEIIVIDNNSRDSSLKIVNSYVKKYPFIRQIFELKNQGKSFAMNTGINNAKTELIVTID